MKKTLMTLALAGSFSLGMTALPLLAQDAPPPPPPPMQQGTNGMHSGGMHRGRMSPDRQLQHLTKALNLTADQQTAIKPILVAQDQKMRSIWQDQSLTHAQRRDQMRAAAHDSKTQLEAVLNPDQKQKFETMMQRRMERMREWRQNHNGPSPQAMNHMHHMRHWKMTPDEQLSRLTVALNLSADQQAKIKPILVAQNEEMQSIWKQQQQERHQLHEQMMADAHQSKTQMDAVLTPDQQQKFDAILHHRMDRMHRWQHDHNGPPPPPQEPQQQQ